MKPRTYLIAGAIAASALAWGCTLARRRAGMKARSGASLPTDAATATSVEREMEDQAMARAQSEVASGEYDMQG